MKMCLLSPTPCSAPKPRSKSAHFSPKNNHSLPLPEPVFLLAILNVASFCYQDFPSICLGKIIDTKLKQATSSKQFFPLKQISISWKTVLEIRQTITWSELFMLAEHYDTGKVQCWSIFFFLGIDTNSLLPRNAASCTNSLELLLKPSVV